MMNDCIDIFIPSYHRPDNCKTAVYYVKKLGWQPSKVHVFVDDEADDVELYRRLCERLGCKLVVFEMQEARRRYDYVHRPSPSRRSAGQARNMMQDYARKSNISFYIVQDDDTQAMMVKDGIKDVKVNGEFINRIYNEIKSFMQRHEIGLFGLSQRGEMLDARNPNGSVLRKKVMNTTFYYLPYVYRGERGVQDNDTSLFCGVMNEGLFTGSFRYGLCLQQVSSAVAKGGLTDLYHECELLNKSLVVPIQFPSAAKAEKQVKNGGRLHHRVNYRYLMPCILKGDGSVDNIRWNAFPEDTPFTNEPKRKWTYEDR